MEMFSKTKKIIITVIAILIVGVIIIFKLQKSPQQKDIVNDNNTTGEDNVVKNTDEQTKAQLIKDNTNDPAVSKNAIENQEFNPELDVTPDSAIDTEEIIEDRDAENL